MNGSPVRFLPGDRIVHAEFGSGVVLDTASEAFLRVFFTVGERRVPAGSVRKELSRTERILTNLGFGEERAQAAHLSLEAHALPLMESAAALTSARIDLLPHQVVLTHRVASASPRRFLVADEVGLGKTIETALVLRELASRGELDRALMVVPAGLVNNWHRELNEVFHLEFEVFGSEGDVTDRKTNAFAKHDRLIASIDTLKRPGRVRRLQEAPRWDLVVFDEAHHLTANRAGGKIRKTENYKLAEVLREKTRDLILLSATPHQGTHFPFWMLVQLLDPALFGSPEEMVQERHRLNAVMVRRTKADACRPDGSPLFARRWVHTESFVMRDDERLFYEALRTYLTDGFDLAKRQGGAARALGFLMAIFQKIAASSFAAVSRTLHRRLIMLTIHEALLRDQAMDIDGREALLNEARDLLHAETNLPRDPMGRAEVDRLLAEHKARMARKLDEDLLELAAGFSDDETSMLQAEETATALVDFALPQERERIRQLLAAFPERRETKIQKLLDGLGVLWRQNPLEKVVIFATYLGSVDLIAREIEATYPGQGVVVLRGGDHGSKLAAERRFRQKDGPRVMVCTAAGREGINLQFARILFNFDLPWNPMDVEQRIGRIHRYGQEHTAQVYNLVLSDTIEGRIYLMLEDKLTEIARAVGKVDENGEVVEDLRAQILGQLSERISYDKLYQEALDDPELKRTRVELEVAFSTAKEAREVVFDLFQDLDGFSLDDYTPFADIAGSQSRIELFASEAFSRKNWQWNRAEDGSCSVSDEQGKILAQFTRDRDKASQSDSLDVVGLDHPLIQRELEHWRKLPPEQIGFSVKGQGTSGVLTHWLVEAQAARGDRRRLILPLACQSDGGRLPALERSANSVYAWPSTPPRTDVSQRLDFLHRVVEPSLQRELRHRGLVAGDAGFSAELVGYVEIMGD